MKKRKTAPTDGSSTDMRVLRGIGVNDGCVSGQVKILGRTSQNQTAPRAKTFVTAVDVAGEQQRLAEARETAMAEISELHRRALTSVGEQEARIFEIHAMFLEDEDLLDSLEKDVAEGRCAEDAVEHTTEVFCDMLAGLSDPYLSARVADLRDIAARLLRILSGHSVETTHNEGKPFILVAEDLTPSETVMLDKTQILGFVTAAGTPHSHTAILARAMGIPALVGVGEIHTVDDGEWALLDAAEGTLTLSPDESTRAAFALREAAQARSAPDEEDELRALIGQPAVTRRGHRIMIYANIGDGREVPSALSAGAEGIGLLRSEFLYLSLHRYPTEAELTAAYSEIARAMDGRRVIIRTLDVGADKQIGYMNLAKEENPALGFRGVRISLARRDMFKTQLRALLRASAKGRVAVMFPMIVSVDEVRGCRGLLDECRAELTHEGVDFDPKMEIGIMIETPAAALMSGELAKEVDFFSVGTNDLTQYTLAADRQNALVAKICDDNHEPVLRLIEMAARAIHREGGWIGICGELAADPQLIPRWSELHIDELSVSTPLLLRVRGRVMEVE